MRKCVIWFCAIWLIGFCLPPFSTGKPAVNRPPFLLEQPEKSHGEYVISVYRGEEWKEVGRLSFNQFPAEKYIDLGVGLPSDEIPHIRIVQQGGGAAHIDFVSLGGNPPIHVKGSADPGAVKKVSQKDHDIMDAFEKTLEFGFPAVEKDRILRLVARVEGREISKTPFQFPRENLYREMTEQSRFYRYDVGAESGNLTSKPFFKEFSRTGSGHPSGFTYGWVGHDAENLYVTIDFTPDNTMDGEKDYAKVYTKTEAGLKEFKISVPETQWGKPSFTYTDKVAYQHKVYEFKIPFKEIGMTDRTEGKAVELAFAAYGTATPGNYTPAAGYNAQGNQYLIVYAKIPEASSEYDIYGQFMGLDGTPLGSEFVISDATSHQTNPSIATGSNGKFLVVWEDDRSGADCIYGQVVNGDGTLHNGNFVISNATPNWRYGPKVANSSTDQRFLVVWQDARGGISDIYGQLVTEDGSLYGTASNVNLVVSNATSYQREPDLAYDRTNNRFLVAWHDTRTSSNSDIYGQLVNPDGTLYGTASNVNFLISNATNDQASVSLAFDEVNSRFLVVWHDGRDFGTKQYDLYGQLVNSHGTLAGANFPIANQATSEMWASVVRDACNGGYQVAWEDGRSGVSSDIYGQFVNEDGTLSGNNFVISEAANDQYGVSFANNGNCGNLAVFETWQNSVPQIGFRVLGGLPDISVSPDSYDLGSVNIGSSSSQEITVWNDGTENLQLISATVSGTDAALFSVGSGGSSPCGDFPATVAAGSSCTLLVTFSPTSGDAKAAVLTVASNDFDEPAVDISLTGTGLYTKVTLLSPNGGEVLDSGENTIIEWGAPAEAVKFKLYYSLNNGATWKTCTLDYIQGTTHPWKVITPSGNKRECWMKVIGYTESNVKVGSDKSDAAFTIEVVKLTSPSGGESIPSGGSHTIEWTVNALKGPLWKTKLYYTTNNGTTWKLIDTLTDPNARSYDWTLPTVIATKTKCKVKVVLQDLAGNIRGKDTSDDVFTIDYLIN